MSGKKEGDVSDVLEAGSTLYAVRRSPARPASKISPATAPSQVLGQPVVGSLQAKERRFGKEGPARCWRLLDVDRNRRRHKTHSVMVRRRRDSDAAIIFMDDRGRTRGLGSGQLGRINI
jgi:hypothetical protein